MSLLDTFLSKRNKNPLGEMTFADHIDDLRGHILRSLVVIILFSVIAFVNIERIFNDIIFAPSHPDFISNIWMCNIARSFNITGLCMDGVNLKFMSTSLSGQFMLSFSSSFFIGFILAFPYVLWEFWRFIRPALKIGEVKQAKGLVFWGSVLFFMGVLFAYYLVAPFTINFFAGYQLTPDIEVRPTASSYYSDMSDMVLGLGVVFELPIVVFFLSRIGMITPKLMRDKRRYAILILLFLSTIITPPDMLSCWFVFIPLYMLYEVSIILSKRVARDRARKQLNQ